MTSDEFKATLISLNDEGLTVKQMANRINCSYGRVRHWIKKYSIKVRNKRASISIKNQEKIIEVYNNGLSMVNTAKKLGISPDLVFETVRRIGKPRSPNDISYRKYDLNRSFFKKIDSEEKAYVLGLFYTDGNIDKKRYRFQISLQKRDSYMIDKITQLICKNSLDYIKFDLHDPTQKRISFSDKEIFHDLLKLGLTPKKSLTIKLPSYDIVPKNLMRHFIRGVFDGDGCAFITKENLLRFNIVSGSFDFITGIKNEIESEIGLINLSVKSKNLKNPLYGITTSKIAFATKAYSYLYEGATIFLTRKKEKFDKVLNSRNIKTC